MSAAAPSPPPHINPVVPKNGYNDAGPAATPRNGVSGLSQRKPFPHLQDLVKNANDRIDLNVSIQRLVEQAGWLVKQAKSSLDFQHPDQAYSEYLAAYTLVVYTIPQQHRDSPSLQDRPQLDREHKRLLKEVLALESTFKTIKDILVQDNLRSGVLPSTVAQDRRASQTPSEPSLQKTKGSVSFASNVQQRNSIRSQDGRSDRDPVTRAGSPTSGKSRPPVQPKPQTLHGVVLSSPPQRSSAQTNGHQSDVLSARFAQLRTDGGTNPAKVNQITTKADTQIPSSGNPLDYFQPKANLNSISSTNNLFPKVPTTLSGVARPARISINPNVHKDLPQPPSPAYSPGRSLQEASPLNPARNTRNSAMDHRGSISSSMPIGSLTYETVGNSVVNGLGISNGSNGPRPSGQLRRKSLNMPRETEITAAKLYDYLTIYNILLVDVRSRDEYDFGHIPHPSGICVEPAALRPSMSAEQLQDALVVSDDTEMNMFKERDKFDLVVYYDQSSTSSEFLSSRPSSKSNMSLRYLHDALHEFNNEKPLLYPPVFMKGGIDAWIDLRGEQALVASSNGIRTSAGKQGRPIARRPLASTASSRLTISKRRLRDYNPLGPEEEEKWRERARSETVVLDSQPQVESSVEDEEEFQSETPYVRDVGDFFQRFPDVATIERQSMMVPAPRAPEYPAPPIPQYQPPAVPSHPPPSVPAVPSRPAPTMQRPSYSGVSDRSASQTMLVPKGPQLAPYIPQKLKKIPRTGLVNFGATCYMNATIQCLSATIPLTAFFLDGAYIKYVQKENWKGSKGIMPELFANLLRNLWQPNGVDTIRPTNFRKMCARLNKEWGSDRQQDANEFLGFLVDVLHEDLNLNWARNPLKPLTIAQEAEREATPPLIASKTEWARYEHRDHSRLTDLFAGQHISRLQCTTCRHSSTTYEPFYSISVEIPQTQTNRPVTLDDCLRSYCASETLSGDEVWRCPHCQTSREATKKILISRAPEFLCVHLKRFSASLGERARKIHTSVDFPLTGLNLDPYMLPPPTPGERDAISKRYGDIDDVPRAMQRPAHYDAYAVMRHLGASMGSGHYIGLVRDAAKGCWREFNDDRIGDFKPEALAWERRLQNEQAYLVFYQRVE